jgi:hypothetical protein
MMGFGRVVRHRSPFWLDDIFQDLRNWVTRSVSVARPLERATLMMRSFSTEVRNVEVALSNGRATDTLRVEAVKGV